MLSWIAVAIVFILVLTIFMQFRKSAGGCQSMEIPQHPDQYTHQDDDDGAYEGSFWELETLYSSDAVVEIDYTDYYGDQTRRIVNISAFGKDDGVGYFTGFCQLRQRPRTFKFDRVTCCVDVASGEVIIDLHDHLIRRYANSPHKALDIMQTDNTDILRVLFYVGKADGSLRASERSIILATCHRFTGDTRITDEMLQKCLKSMDRPSLNAFKLAVARLMRTPLDKRAWLIDAAERIVATQKTAHPAEREAVTYLMDHLGHTA